MTNMTVWDISIVLGFTLSARLVSKNSSNTSTAVSFDFMRIVGFFLIIFFPSWFVIFSLKNQARTRHIKKCLKPCSFKHFRENGAGVHKGL